MTDTAPDDPRERIIQGAVRSIARHGLERSSITSVAREAGVSRQTVYTHFGTREDVLREAVTRSATELSRVVLADAANSPSAVEFVVELMAGTLRGVREHAAIAAMMYSLDTAEGREMAMSPAIQEIVSSMLRPVLDRAPELEPKFGEITETCLRLQLSLLTYPSARTRDTKELKSYLREVLGSMLTVAT